MNQYINILLLMKAFILCLISIDSKAHIPLLALNPRSNTIEPHCVASYIQMFILR